MSKLQTYTLTFMEKFLGKNYKWWYVLMYSFKQTNVNLKTMVLFQLNAIIEFVITMFIWSLVDKTPETTSYFFIVYIIQRVTYTQFGSLLSFEIISGKITARLLRPSSITKNFLFAQLGSRIIPNLFSFYLIITLALLFYSSNIKFPNLNPGFIINLMPFFGISFLISFLSQFLIGCFGFFGEEGNRAYITIFEQYIIKILSGIIIPFSFLNPFLRDVLVANPFSYLSHHISQIYLGKYTPVQTGWALLGGIAWCFLLYLLARFVFKMGLKRNEAVGL